MVRELGVAVGEQRVGKGREKIRLDCPASHLARPISASPRAPVDPSPQSIICIPPPHPSPPWLQLPTPRGRPAARTQRPRAGTRGRPPGSASPLGRRLPGSRVSRRQRGSGIYELAGRPQPSRPRKSLPPRGDGLPRQPGPRIPQVWPVPDVPRPPTRHPQGGAGRGIQEGSGRRRRHLQAGRQVSAKTDGVARNKSWTWRRKVCGQNCWTVAGVRFVSRSVGSPIQLWLCVLTPCPTYRCQKGHPGYILCCPQSHQIVEPQRLLSGAFKWLELQELLVHGISRLYKATVCLG
ncbi:uncharacterized protein LOC143658365 [Tamandua tetradactyla]|uniref:uncharacterized protein LOC143658365 n=1 Tax=Tamandua tetradactyla TaxID=48850 RepID=UPI004053DFD9